MNNNFLLLLLLPHLFSAANINDKVQHEATINRNSSLILKGIDDVLEENAEMKERIRWLEDVITNNISELVDSVTNVQDDMLIHWSWILKNNGNISDNLQMISDNTASIHDTHIIVDKNTQLITSNTDKIFDNTDKISDNNDKIS